MTIYFTDDFDFKTVCKIGEGHDTCAFIIADQNGIGCARMDQGLSDILIKRIDNKQMTALGKGGWAGCIWEEDLK